MAAAASDNTDNKIIPFDSSEAAQKKSVEGWVSNDGYFYADDERTARFAGCTHVQCADCQNLIPKRTTVCDSCAVTRQDNAFAALKQKPWDNETPLVIFNTDVYFFDRESLTDYCEQHSTAPEKLQLVLCKPVFGSELDIADHLAGDLPDDAEVPQRIQEAAKHLNQVIQAAGPLCWIQGDYAADLSTTVTSPTVNTPLDRATVEDLTQMDWSQLFS